jgi:predicted nucleic acid-binding protein
VSVLVVDASVDAKWFLPDKGETLVDEALRLLHQYAAGEIRFRVPDLFWAELGNLFWKAVRWRKKKRTNSGVISCEFGKSVDWLLTGEENK